MVQHFTFKADLVISRAIRTVRYGRMVALSVHIWSANSIARRNTCIHHEVRRDFKLRRKVVSKGVAVANLLRLNSDRRCGGPGASVHFAVGQSIPAFSSAHL